MHAPKAAFEVRSFGSQQGGGAGSHTGPNTPSSHCTYSSVSSSELSAVKALFGEMPIQGSLPVTIPHVAERGAGIRRPALTARKMARRSVSP